MQKETSYSIKVKRGFLWSERQATLSNGKVRYYNNSVIRFEQPTTDCILIKEEFPNDPKKHTITIASKNKKFDEVKLANDNNSALIDFIKDFNNIIKNSDAINQTIEPAKNLEETILDKTIISEFEDIRIKSNSKGNLALSEEKVPKEEINEIKEEIKITPNKKSEPTLEVPTIIAESTPNQNLSNKKESVLAMKLESVIFGSNKIPLTEIVKSLFVNIDDKMHSTYYKNSKLSSNYPLSELDYLVGYKEQQNSLHIKSTLAELENNQLKLKVSTRSNNILLLLCLILSLSFSYENYEETSNIELLAVNLFLILLLVVVMIVNVKQKIITFEYKPVLPSSDNVLKISGFINENQKEVFNFLSNHKFSKEYLKSLTNTVENEANSSLLYIFNGEDSNEDTKIKVKRLAIKKSQFSIIAEFIEADLMKLVIIEGIEDSDEIKGMTKISIFLPLNVQIKNNLPHSVTLSIIDSLDLIINYFNNRNFNDVICNPGEIEMNNYLIREALTKVTDFNQKTRDRTVSTNISLNEVIKKRRVSLFDYK